MKRFYLKVSTFESDEYVKTFRNANEMFAYINHECNGCQVEQFIVDAAGNITGAVVCIK